MGQERKENTIDNWVDFFSEENKFSELFTKNNVTIMFM